jgi:hypothetical protein
LVLPKLVSESFIKPIISNKVMLPFQRTFISSYPEATQDTQLVLTHATSNLGIRLNGKWFCVWKIWLIRIMGLI